VTLTDPDATRYRVTEAILVTRGEGSAWRVTFSRENAEPGASDGHISLDLPPSLVDNMFFDVSYSREEVTALGEGTWDG
jgi:hypothetical protein